MTPEQEKARAGAREAALAASKRGALQDAIDEALQLTDEQRAARAETEKEVKALDTELRDKVLSALTPEQMEQVMRKMGRDHKK